MERFSPRRSPDRDYFHRDRGDFGHHDEGVSFVNVFNFLVCINKNLSDFVSINSP